MAVIVNLQVQVKEGEGPAFLEALHKVVPETRAYDGCSEVNICTNMDEGPDKVEAISKWETKEHYDKYLKWRIETGALEAMSTFFADEPVFRFLEVDSTY